MKLCGAIDLHSTNNVSVLTDEQDKIVYQKRLPNDLGLILKELSAYRSELEGIVVESTYNWYWLVDGLTCCGWEFCPRATSIRNKSVRYAICFAIAANWCGKGQPIF